MSVFVGQLHVGPAKSNYHYAAGSTSSKDIDASGRMALFIGDATEDTEVGTDAGRACLFKAKSRSQWAALFSTGLDGADFCIEGASAGDHLGSSVAIGDVAGGAEMDYIVAAPFGDTGTSGAATDVGEISIIQYKLPATYQKPVRIKLSNNW